ncbi:hypothetical protein VaNZ11_004284 [Volvox africanus]|uniref:Uncharacterized protein n=1 Tax=Volvox africanus TaxID=51714 RepID=A0ABQ5RVZ3_9CHLO|nr:hypothetical protein VaNZ11_004284 [Volvox africanus]
MGLEPDDVLTAIEAVIQDVPVAVPGRVPPADWQGWETVLDMLGELQVVPLVRETVLRHLGIGASEGKAHGELRATSDDCGGVGRSLEGLRGYAPVGTGTRIVDDKKADSQALMYKVSSSIRTGNIEIRAWMTEEALRSVFQTAAEPMLAHWQTLNGRAYATVTSTASPFDPISAGLLINRYIVGPHVNKPIPPTQHFLMPQNQSPRHLRSGRPEQVQVSGPQTAYDKPLACDPQPNLGGGAMALKRGIDGTAASPQEGVGGGRQPMEPQEEPKEVRQLPGDQSSPRHCRPPPAHPDDHDPNSSYCDPEAAAALGRSFKTAFMRVYERKLQRLLEAQLLAEHSARFGAGRGCRAGKRGSPTGGGPAAGAVHADSFDNAPLQLRQHDPVAGPIAAAGDASLHGAIAIGPAAAQQQDLAAAKVGTEQPRTTAQGLRQVDKQREDVAKIAQDGEERSGEEPGLQDGYNGKGLRRKRGAAAEAYVGADSPVNDDTALRSSKCRRLQQSGHADHQQAPSPPLVTGIDGAPGPHSATTSGITISSGGTLESGAVSQPAAGKDPETLLRAGDGTGRTDGPNQHAQGELWRYHPMVIPDARAEAAWKKLGQVLRARQHRHHLELADPQQQQGRGEVGLAQQTPIRDTGSPRGQLPDDGPNKHTSFHTPDLPMTAVDGGTRMQSAGTDARTGGVAGWVGVVPTSRTTMPAGGDVMPASGAGDEAMPMRNHPGLGIGENTGQHDIGDAVLLPHGVVTFADSGGGGASTRPRPSLQSVPRIRRPPPWLAGRGLPRTSQARDTGASPTCAQGLVVQAQPAGISAAEVQRANQLHPDPEGMSSPPRASGRTRSMCERTVEAAPLVRTPESGVPMHSTDLLQSASRSGPANFMVDGVQHAQGDVDVRASITSDILTVGLGFPVSNEVDISKPLHVNVDLAAVATFPKRQGEPCATAYSGLKTASEAPTSSPGHQEQHGSADDEDSRPDCPLPVEEGFSEEDESFRDPIGSLEDIVGAPDTLLGGKHSEQQGAVSAAGTQSTPFASPRTEQWDASEGQKDGPEAGEAGTGHAEREESPQEDLENGHYASPEVKFGSQGIQTSQCLLDSWLRDLQQQHQCELSKQTIAVQTSQAYAVLSSLQPGALQLPPRMPIMMQPRQSQQVHGSLEPTAASHGALAEGPPITANGAQKNGQAAQVNQVETANGAVARTASRPGSQLATLEMRGEGIAAKTGGSDNLSAVDHVSAVGSAAVTVVEKQPVVKGLGGNDDSVANVAVHDVEAELPPTSAPVQDNATTIASSTAVRIGGLSASAPRYGRLVRRGIPLEDVQAWLAPPCAPLVAPSLVQDSLDVRNVAAGITCWPDVTMAVLRQLHSTTARPPSGQPPQKAAGPYPHHEALWRDNWLPTQLPRSVHDPGMLPMARDMLGRPPSSMARPAAPAAAVATLEAAMCAVREHRASIIAAMTVDRGAGEGVSAAGNAEEQDRDDLMAAAPVHMSHGVAGQFVGGPTAFGDAQQGTGCPADHGAVEPATSNNDVLSHAEKQQHEQQEEVVAEPTQLFQDFGFASESGPPMFFTQPLTQSF